MAQQVVSLPEIKFSCSIVCIPERYQYARRLKERIPHATIFTDTNKKGSWYAHREAMLDHDPSKTHHVILEEDVSICDNFIATINNIITAVPDRFVSLFNFRGLQKGNIKAKYEGRHFFTRDGSTGQGILFPTPQMMEWIRWSDLHIPFHVPYEDTRLHAYLKTKKSHLYICVPNIIEHLLPSDSTIDSKLNNKHRISPDFIGEYNDGSLIDWSKGLDLVPDKPELHTNHKEFFSKWMGKQPPFNSV
jgi:hypothetical protein